MSKLSKCQINSEKNFKTNFENFNNFQKNLQLKRKNVTKTVKLKMKLKTPTKKVEKLSKTLCFEKVVKYQ